MTAAPETPAPRVHVAFAGGGWRAHSGHSGWTLALLDGGRRDVADVFQNVGHFGSNSGGSWFSTMLMFSERFVQAIEAPDARTTWTNTGWIGQQETLFNAADVCSALEGDAFTACIFEEYSPEGLTRWASVIEGLVFRDYPLDLSVTLASERRPWAQGKALVLASTLLTSDVVLNEAGLGSGFAKQYVQACVSPLQPLHDGGEGSSCADGGEVRATPDVTAAAFSSLSPGSQLSPLPFLPAAGAGRPVNLGYTVNSDGAIVGLESVNNPIAVDAVPVVRAAAASSAAAGFAASHAVTGDWELAYEGSDEALAFRLAGGRATFVDVTDFTLRELTDQHVVRLADGGPVDNSGVAHLVAFLQRNGLADGFEIVAFDNVEGLYRPAGPAAPVGVDVANLFGAGLSDGDKYCSGPDGTGVCITVPDIQIFDEGPLSSPPELTWSAAAESSTEEHPRELVYTRYSVTTVANETLGITAGSRGTLHAFTCAWSGAAVAPQNIHTDGDFKAYAAMVELIDEGLRRNDGEGLR
ncbi:MAG: hypothetical protein AAGF23_01840, partial [Acidobacteriota bacterium]